MKKLKDGFIVYCMLYQPMLFLLMLPLVVYDLF